jgi:Txe/YoeB family toxin of toxin-antitoxin system
MKYELYYTKQAQKDYERVKQLPALLKNLKKIIATLKENPYQLPYEKLSGGIQVYSRRLNIQHRVLYEIVDEKTVKVIRMWSHYE